MEREFHIRKKKSHRSTILFLGIAVLAFITAIKYIPEKKSDEIINETEEAAALKADEDERLNKASAFKLTTVYSCGHIKTKTGESTEELIGKTKNEVQKLHPDWEIKEFNKNLLTAELCLSYPCDDHYVIKLKGDTLKVYRENNQTESLRQQKINTDMLTPSDIAELTTGIPASTEFELLEILESFV